MRHNNIRIIGIPEGEEKEQGIETLLEKNNDRTLSKPREGKNHTNSGNTEGPNQDDPKEAIPRHIIIKTPSFKGKGRILKTAREKPEVTYKGALIRLAADFSTDTLQARKEWQKIFQVMKSKGLQPRLLCPVRLSIKMEGRFSRWR